MLALLAVAVALMRLTDSDHWQHGIGVYLAANWAAPFGIALVADRLAALMLLLTAAARGCRAALFDAALEPHRRAFPFAVPVPADGHQRRLPDP